MTTLQFDARSLTSTPRQGPVWSADRQRRTGRALGGIAAQGSQAAASLVLQLIALRALGLDGLAVFGTLYAVVIMATAVSTGFVGDSLTVLDRGARSVRAGLQAWSLVIFAAAGGLSGAVLWLAGFVSGPVALLVGAATIAFLAEDVLRRLLMATLQFWRIVLVDVVALLTSVAVVLVSLWLHATIDIGTVVLALLVGQVLATAVAIGCLPRSERRLVSLRGAAMKTVASYGAWRAVQQASRPALQAAVRFVCVALISLAAVGELEAARIYLAPATVAIAGLSSVLFATYAADSSSSLAVLLRRADRTIALLLAVVSVVVVAAVLAVPAIGSLLTGNGVEMSPVLVAGWGLYAIAIAAATPYGALAAARGRQRAVLAVRGAEVGLSLLAVLAVLQWSGVIWLVPAVLGVVTLISAVITRMWILAPLARTRSRIESPTGTADPLV